HDGPLVHPPPHIVRRRRNRIHGAVLAIFLCRPAATALSTLSLHELFRSPLRVGGGQAAGGLQADAQDLFDPQRPAAVEPLLERRSEEHTSELQSRVHLVCRLLLEKEKRTTIR